MKNLYALGLAALLCAGSAWGQASAGFGAVTGIITDPGGEGLPDVTVVLSNEALGTEHTMNTSGDGLFNAQTVAPALGYRLKAMRKGFADWESNEFEVSTGQKLNFAVAMDAEENAGQAAGRGGLHPIDEIQRGLSAGISAAQAQETPNSGRRLDALVPLAPMVSPAESLPGVWVFHGVPFSNLSLTDGLLTTNMYFPVKPGIANHLAEDAVQAFRVESAVFPGEFGHTMGGMVDAGSRSGTTAYHGEAYEYYRNRSLQAPDRYALGYNTRQLQHQAGANLGGPLHGEKLFFFLSFDFLDRNAQGLNRITNPLIADSTGTRVVASNCRATAAQCALATRFLQSQMNVLEPLWDKLLRGLVKVDYRRGEHNSFSFVGNGMDWHAPALAETETVAANGGFIGQPIIREKTRFAKAGWTVTNSSQITNDFRIGWFQDRVAEYPTATGLSTGLLGISIAGTVVGGGRPYTAILPSEHRLQLVDNGNWTLGSHSIKAGFQLLRTSDYLNSLSNAAGWYAYPSLTAFAQDFGLTGQRNYTTYSQTLGTAARTLNYRYLHFYAEDSFRLMKRLTIDLGLRYERPRLPQPTQVNTAFFQTGSIPAPWLELSPRVGAALLLSERTVIRAGFGFYYAPITGQMLDALFLGNGLYQTSISASANQAGAPVFPNIVKTTSAIPNGTTNVAYVQSTFKNEYAQETSIAVERRISSDTSVTVSLLHSRGYKLWTTQDANLAAPTLTQTYAITNASGQPAGSYATSLWTTKINGNFAHAYQIENGGSSWYNAAALQVRKRMAHGVMLDATYTFAHGIDNTGQSVPFGTGISGSSNSNYNADKGNSAFDQRHRAAIQWLWQPKLSSSNSAAARYLLNGWELSSITTMGSSQRVTELAIVEGQQFSGATMAYTSSLNGSGGWARVPFLPTGTLQTGPQYNVDARLARPLPITERVRVVLMAEAFNAFNTQYDTAVNQIGYLSIAPVPVGVVNPPRAGILQPVSGVGKGNAAQGFPDGTNARRLQVALRIVF